jgi:hypothetical protein
VTRGRSINIFEVYALYYFIADTSPRIVLLQNITDMLLYLKDHRKCNTIDNFPIILPGVILCYHVVTSHQSTTDGVTVLFFIFLNEANLMESKLVIVMIYLCNPHIILFV